MGDREQKLCFQFIIYLMFFFQHNEINYIYAEIFLFTWFHRPFLCFCYIYVIMPHV